MEQALGPFYHWLMPPLIMAAALLINRMLPGSWLLAPRLHQVADALAAKVNRPQRAPSQQRLAGSIATALMVLPPVALLAAAMSLAAYPGALQCLLIALCLPGDQQRQQHRLLVAQLHGGLKQRARQTLAPFTVRQTDSLSEVGLCKASIESRLIQEAGTTFSWLLYYPLLGFEAALTVWLINQLARQWLPWRPQYRNFGHLCHTLASVLSIPVNALLAFTLSLYGNTLNCWKALTGPRTPVLESRHWLTTAMAYHLNVQLGGPLLIDNQRLERPRVGPAYTPTTATILQADRLIQFARWLWVALLVLSTSAVAMIQAGAW
ncbi:adenosylcobinamide-phosphate synthase [Ferrimonas sediminum]|uniref:Adenosylcobinamide-phosphate synthase n=1 Tax=Ferrimonas sediminum TaxID=718193 RepID=A0A1G8M4D8_9GAMM|nr:cobalamin biosynthesis protein [Ferrimonas sediminum]SDI62771.1 adenosylcobinamide-phosphate synthase [Ferrimonas sediminum]